MVPYELPVDYVERRTDRMHLPSNVKWIEDGELLDKVLGLRRLLLSEVSGAEAVAFAAAYDKIRVKTYLTDRVQTGVHQTDREKRWEAHPGSVHFALRVSCLAIECRLVEEMLHFDGFPEAVRVEAIQRGLATEGRVARCPVTLAPMSYGEFSESLVDPSHGKSAFQVGHLSPLKSEVPAGGQAGHVPGNVAWVSDEGNRIQGHRSLDETRALIRGIARRYELEDVV